MDLQRSRAAVLCAVILATGVVAGPASAQEEIGAAPDAAVNTEKDPTRDHARNAPPSDDPEYVPGEVLVGYKAGVGPSERADVRAAVAMSRIRELLVPRVELLKTPKGTSVEDAIVRLQRDPRVRFAEANYYVHALSTTPNDPYFSELWGQHNTGQTVNSDTGIADADIDAPEAWDQETGDPNVVVAVADTGVAFEHPDLAGNKWTNAGETVNGSDDDGNGYVDDVNGYDFIDNDPDPSDYQTHGTHVAGTIGAVGNDGFGVNGVAWDVSLMGVRVLDSNGSGSYEAIANGFYYAGEEGADVLNASLGGGGTDSIAASIKAAIDAHPDTLYVVAAGNEANNNETSGRYPCNISSANLLCVAATDNNDALADFSNYGSTAVDMGAPGVTIKSTIPSSVQIGTPYSFEGTGTGSGDGWTTGGNTVPWVYTNEDASVGSWSLSDSSYNAAGELYVANANSWVQSPALNLAGRRGCDIAYDINYDLEDGYDFLDVETSTDGVTWKPTGVDHTGWSFWMWESHSAPIDALDGDASAFVRFRLTSDEATQYDGVYLDNVRIECLDTPNSLDYDYYNGTSMATPQVAGAAAILFSANPSATVAEVKSALMNEGDSLAALAGKTVSGKRLNLKSSLDAIGSGPPPITPSVSIANASLPEGDSGSTNMTFDVSLSTSATETVSVTYGTTDGTAEAGSDYTTSTGTVTLNPGQTAKTVNVPILGDTVDEANETFTVGLSAPTGATLGDSEGTGTIQDDDGVATVEAPTLTKPSAKYTKKKAIALRWAHDSMAATFDVEVRRAPHDGAFGAPQIVETGLSGDSTKFTGVAGSTYCFKVSATDGGNTSDFSNEKCTTIPLDDRTLKIGTGWGKKTGKGYFLNTYVTTKKKGKSLTLGNVQGQELALIVEKCSGCGKVKVFFNGAAIKQISLNGTKTKKKVIVPIANFGSSQTGALKITTTTKGKRVAIDGVAVVGQG